jgi:pyridoxine 5-phosphate synthase
MVDIACRVKPHMAMLVPEGRLEVTTEGGLDVAAAAGSLKEQVARMRDDGIMVSAFIDPDLRQVEAAAECGFQVCEVHTGRYAEVFHDSGRDSEGAEAQSALAGVAKAGEAIRAAGMRFNAGHALNYANVQPVAALPGIRELHIGHSVVSRAIFVGLREAVREMKSLLREAAGGGGSMPGNT